MKSPSALARSTAIRSTSGPGRDPAVIAEHGRADQPARYGRRVPIAVSGSVQLPVRGRVDDGAARTGGSGRRAARPGAGCRR